MSARNPYWNKNRSWVTGNTGFIQLRDNNNNIIGLVLIDSEDFNRCIGKKWRLKKGGRPGNHMNHFQVYTGQNDAGQQLGRFILKLEKRELNDYYICHKNDNPLDFKKENLFSWYYPI